jgi:hypothetical protein
MAARDAQDCGADTLKFRVWLPRFSHHHILNTVKAEGISRQEFNAGLVFELRRGNAKPRPILGCFGHVKLLSSTIRS